MTLPALALARRQLGRRVGARIGWLLAAIGALVMIGASADGEGDLIAETARLMCWLGAGPLALSAAASPAIRDRREGIEGLAMIHGVGPIALGRLRTLASMIAGASRVSVPVAVVGVWTSALSPGAGVMLKCAAAVILGALAGAIVGGIAALAGEAGRERGRALFLALVFLPWLVSDLWSIEALSIPGALDAGLSLLGAPG